MNILLLPLYILAKIIPQNKNIWVFGSWYGNKFSDNSRFLFEYVVKKKEEIRPIWLTKDKAILDYMRGKGFEVYLINSILGYWYTSRSSVVIFTSGLVDINRVGVSNSIRFQLWHGTPLKKIGYDDSIYTNPKPTKQLVERVKYSVFPFLNENWDAIISPSPLVSKIFESAFKLDSKSVYLTGYPRQDSILSKKPRKISVIEEFKERYRAKRVIGYFPTFRTEREHFNDLFRGLDFTQIDQVLKELDSVLIIKAHYMNENAANFKEKLDGKRIFLLGNNISDINLILPFIDVLITDYSSVFFDYLPLNRPIIFTPFDIKRYLSSDRELYEDYNTVTPGAKCYSWIDVIRVLKEIFNNKDDYAIKRKQACEKYINFIDTNNSKRVAECITKLVQKK